MAVYRKKLVDKDGNTIIPAIGDIYGPVYTASLSSASGGIATYTFTPDTPVEANRVYAVKFPAPTTNNTIILGDGTTFGSVLVPPVAATDSPNYELLDTTMINDTEPLLLMYNDVQWVCLNQKNKVATADLDNGAVTSDSIDWDSILKRVEKTVTLDGTGNADLNILPADYWIIAIRERGTGTFKNAHLTTYTWSDGHYYVHGDKNFGNTYATGSINIEILMIKKSAIGM